MQIVTRSAPFSYSPVPLLTAPPPPKLLAAPCIAGLLPARVPAHTGVVLEMPLTREELMQQLGPIRSRAEMNAEIAALAFDLFDLVDFPHSTRHVRPHAARPSIPERLL